jgi:hypothetical protein
MSKEIHVRISKLLIGCVLTVLSGCGQRTPAVSEDATHHSSLITRHSSDTTPQSDEQFPFPADREGQLLAEKLRPSDQVPPQADEKRIGQKHQPGPSKVENPDVPLPAATVSRPATIPLEKGRGKPVRPTLLEGDAPLLRQRIEVDQPAIVKLPAAPKVAWPSPDINEPIPLPILARPVADRAGLDDPSGEVSQAAALASNVPERTTTAPFLRLNLPDPFEHRNTVRLRTPAPEIRLPADQDRPPADLRRRD